MYERSLAVVISFVARNCAPHPFSGARNAEFFARICTDGWQLVYADDRTQEVYIKVLDECSFIKSLH